MLNSKNWVNSWELLEIIFCELKQNLSGLAACFPSLVVKIIYYSIFIKEGNNLTTKSDFKNIIKPLVLGKSAKLEFELRKWRHFYWRKNTLCSMGGDESIRIYQNRLQLLGSIIYFHFMFECDKISTHHHKQVKKLQKLMTALFSCHLTGITC